MTKQLWYHFETPCEMTMDEEIECENLPEDYRHLAYFGKYLERCAG